MSSAEIPTILRGPQRKCILSSGISGFVVLCSWWRDYLNDRITAISIFELATREGLAVRQGLMY